MFSSWFHTENHVIQTSEELRTKLTRNQLVNPLPKYQKKICPILQRKRDPK